MAYRLFLFGIFWLFDRFLKNMWKTGLQLLHRFKVRARGSGISIILFKYFDNWCRNLSDETFIEHQNAHHSISKIVIHWSERYLMKTHDFPVCLYHLWNTSKTWRCELGWVIFSLKYSIAYHGFLTWKSWSV